MKQSELNSQAGVDAFDMSFADVSYDLSYDGSYDAGDSGSDGEDLYSPGDFSREMALDAAGVPSRIAIFADRPHVRREVSEDLAGAGFRTLDGGPIETLLDGPITLLGDVVMIECPVAKGAVLAALARLDMRIAQAGAQLIVSTSLDALDDVFAAFDQSQPQILVQPTRAERVVAVGRVMANISNGRVREMTEEDRLSLLHLSRQVEAIAHTLEGLSDHSQSYMPGSDGLASSDAKAGGAPGMAGLTSPARIYNSAQPAAPDPRFVRQIIANRQARSRFFDGELFADPAWDMLLDLTAAHGEQAQVSVTSLCIAAGVPATTALRWLKQMVECGIFERIADPSDKRRAFIALSAPSLDAMGRYFAEVETPMAKAA